MKTLRTGIIASILLAVISLAACKKNGVAPSSTSANGPQLSFQMQADNNASLAAAANKSLSTNAVGIPGLTFTSAVANISRFKLEATKNGVETEISTRNLSNVNLFALSPALANVSITPGTYTHVEVKVDLARPDTGFALKVTGTFTNASGGTTPFELDLNDNLEVKAEAQNITVTDTTNFLATVHLHLPRLEAGITASDLDNGTLTNGVLVISSTSNANIYRRVVENLANAGETEFRHHDRDDHDRGDDNGNDNNGNGGGDNSGSGSGNGNGGGPGKG